MKSKDILFLLTRWRPKPRVYPYTTLSVDLADGPIEYAIWDHPRAPRDPPTQAELDELQSFIRAGDVCIDIGAHTGDTSVPMALAAGPSGACLAIDPNEYTYPTLDQNSRLNLSRMRLIPIRCAITTEDGPVTLHYSDAGFCNGGLFRGMHQARHGHFFDQTANGRRLDTLLADFPEYADRLRYIKIDAEGHDVDILRSIESIIRKQHPHLKIEVHPDLSIDDRRELLERLMSLGYKVWRVKAPSHLRGEAVDHQTILLREHFDIFAEPSPG